MSCIVNPGGGVRGRLNDGSKLDEASHHNWVMANQRMAGALNAKGYPYRYVFDEAAGHTGGRATKQTLPPPSNGSGSYRAD